MNRLFFLLLTVSLFLSACSGPGQYVPSSGGGPVVLMLSGKSGPSLYTEFARRLADSGYTVLLQDGNDFPVNQTDLCQSRIRAILQNPVLSSVITTDKAVVIGYSLGGAVALACAAGMKEEVAGVIAYYPATRMIADHDACVERLRVPVTVLQGEEDHFFECCPSDAIRQISAKAAAQGKQMELFVYPGAGHGFNLGYLKNRELDEDSWGKTLRALKTYGAGR